jgi:hypothetical protein
MYQHLDHLPLRKMRHFARISATEVIEFKTIDERDAFARQNMCTYWSEPEQNEE